MRLLRLVGENSLFGHIFRRAGCLRDIIPRDSEVQSETFPLKRIVFNLNVMFRGYRKPAKYSFYLQGFFQEVAYY